MYFLNKNIVLYNYKNKKRTSKKNVTSITLKYKSNKNNMTYVGIKKGLAPLIKQLITVYYFLKIQSRGKSIESKTIFITVTKNG